MDRHGNTPIRDVTLAEMLEAINGRDEDAFRYFQKSHVGSEGWAIPDETLRVTIGQVRREIK